MTPPNYASFWDRTIASLLDTIILLCITLPILTAIYGKAYLKGDALFHGTWDAVFNYIFPAIAVIAFWIYKAATPGKIAIKLEIVDATTGEKPSKKQFVIRYLGYYVSLFGLFFGFFWVVFDKRRQGWHDKIANTLVISHDPASTTTPAPQSKTHTLRNALLIFLFYALLFACLALIAFFHQLPSTMVEKGSELNSTLIDDLVGINALENGEKIHYFYSESPFSYTEAGNFFTDSRVVSYETKQDERNIYSASYADISDITFDASDSWIRDSEIIIHTHGEEDFSLLVSIEDDGDDLFYNKLLAQWHAKRDE